MKIVIILCLSLAAVSAIDLRMCMRNCKKNEFYCKFLAAPGEFKYYCTQKSNECYVGCVQNCKSGCARKFTIETCVEECQYRGMMMLEMQIPFVGKKCMDECLYQGQRCNLRCKDAFFRNNLHRPQMEFIEDEQLAEDWSVGTGLQDNPNRPAEPSFPSSNAEVAPGRRY